jgi:NAD(P)-dependent dehydrogenase (short-subunit alcohol dehydrogenase family)
VLLTSRSTEAAEQAAAELGEGAVGFGAHAADEDAAGRCVEHALERFGRLDILINNAGTNPAFSPLVELDRARFEKTFEVNVWAPILWSGLAWRAWMGEHGGSIVNIASINGGQLVANSASRSGARPKTVKDKP